MNQIILIGRLTKDIDLRYSPKGKPVAKFTLAVNRRYAKETDEIKADFFPIVIWGKPAENCQKYLSQGSLIGVSGELRNRNYTDKNGVKRYITEILANSIEFLSHKKTENNALSNEIAPYAEEVIPQIQEEQGSLYDEEYISLLKDEDLPF